MRRSLALAGALCLVTLSACSPGERPHVGVDPTAMPTGLSECRHISVEGDPGLGAGFHYDELARHRLGESARLLVCVHPWDSGSRTDDVARELTADDPTVTVTPVAEIAHDGIIEVRLTVDGPADGARLDMTFAGGGFSGPTVHTDDTHWWLGPWGDGVLDE
ncbi:hypothetical protein Cch01nite_13990 [Cellulomonas chitinilytica]|uniref:Lipoprotein n=1 Tax=Cellulomonas chitinilytica TaxID=398759 RepID=A0A919TYJ8_9CELL|nr:hypothetical protein [Cellulomonas chitinilytica]GIG20675.1 hypothetical protein Cch01nite_13990 [Cellulomonas chitinilytica]